MSISELLIEKTPKYDLTIPSSKKKVQYRPFLVKEEKILLIAQETNNSTATLQAIKTIIESCVSGIDDVNNLPLFDIEYIFLQLRAKSVGELIEPTIICPETQEKILTQINIEEIQLTTNKNHKTDIKISDEIIISMKYPSISLLENLENLIDYNNPATFYQLLIHCIKHIQTPEQKINAEDISIEELEEFVDNLNKKQFEQLLNFFATSPRLEKEIIYKTSDDVERKVVLQGISDFFGLGSVT